MKIKMIKQTFVKGKLAEVGKVIDASESDTNLLIGNGHAVAVAEAVKKPEKKAVEKTKKKGGGFSFGKKTVKPQKEVIFSKKFTTMVQAALPILNVSPMIRDHRNQPKVKEFCLS